MAISQASGNAGLNPGIYTSSTRPASPADGLVISETDTDSLSVYKGSAWSPVSGLTFISSASPSAVTSVSINNCFTSTYTNYRILFSPTAISTAADVTLRLRASGTDTTTNYKYQTTESLSGSVYPTADIVGTDEWYMGRIDTPVAMAFSADIYNPQTTNKTAYTTNSVFQNSSNSVTAQTMAGFQTSTTQFDGFTLLFAGTLTGTIRVYGYANS